MTKPENGHLPLSCQELSKQCNDVDSSSSNVGTNNPLSHSQHAKKMVRRNLFMGSYSSLHHRKIQRTVSSGYQGHAWKQTSHPERFRARSLPMGPEDMTSSQNICADDFDDDCFGDDDDDFDEEELEDGDHRRQRGHMAHSEWMDFPEYSLSQPTHDFLDEIESTLHLQVDDEIDAFRSNLHSLITHQQDRCRQLLASQEQDDSQTPSHGSPLYAYQEEDKNMSPSQTVPHAAESEDTSCTWTSDVMHNLSDQQRIETMSTSTSSLQEVGTTQISTSANDGLTQELLLNRIAIQLLSSALCISNSMQREEYAT